MRIHFPLVVLFFVFLVNGAAGEITEIFKFQNGIITWTNAYTQGVATIEWASSVTGKWYDSWEGYNHQPVPARVTSAEVPMFFRIVNDPMQIDWVVVSNAHNTADSSGFGAVNYVFRMSKYEINNGQYALFLNSVDPTGVNSQELYSALMGSTPRGGITNNSATADGFHYTVKTNMIWKPVNYVSFWDAARFVNWLNNGQGGADTETGAYELTSKNPGNTTVSRLPGARFFIPNEDEWYKTAYYDNSEPKYWLYPIKSDSAPNMARCDNTGNITNDSTFIANYASGATWNGVTGTVTDVGSGGLGSQTFYGATDMAGNLYEWNEAIISTDLRCIRGGAWYSVAEFLQSSARNGYHPFNEFDSVGFRIATR